MLEKLHGLLTAFLVAVGYYGPTKIISYGPLPQKIAVYDRMITTADFWDGPVTLDPNDLSYVRGEKRFHNPSNYGLQALPDLAEPWINRRMHFDESCNQANPLTPRQLLPLP
ncbi:hypothetical protein H8B02_30660 [Bradyrhizobium sp. Pear77]|uniref:hypothetical protein n=1 Tax=Bradyrhizobium altum TaxID=1571202 RepID=UPI001E2D4C05|nr:hypothetical protein [Bradyrhizobium altum]MCC8957637.1 hypothetical protein [Bradyrhizobium altum]